MRVFITGTDTNIGKTLVSSWLCLHTGSDYFKPIQTGAMEGTDSSTVFHLAGVQTHPESYLYPQPVSPHLAAQIANELINIDDIQLPSVPSLIVEGAGGVLTPLTSDSLMIDLMNKFRLPVLLVARSCLGTINHTLLTLGALRKRNISVLGVILSGEPHVHNLEAIEFYGKVKVVGQIPFLNEINTHALKQIPLGPMLTQLFEGKNEIK